MIRTFVALPFPPEAQERIVALQQQLRRRLDAVRWIAPANLHLTLSFLGEIPETQVLDVVAAVEEACDTAPAYELGLHGLGVFPNARKPRVLWVDVRTGREETLTLQRLIAENLEVIGFPPEDRAFTPHLTVGRCPRPDRLSRSLPRALEEHAEWVGGPYPIDEVHVLSSQLSRQKGAHYQTMATVEMRG